MNAQRLMDRRPDLIVLLSLLVLAVPAPGAERQRPGKVFKDCADCPKMVIIPAGGFTMGSPSSEAGRDANESPQHRVSLTTFALGKIHVTRGQFAAFVNATGYKAGSECFVWEGGRWEKKSGRDWRNPGYSQNDSHPAVCLNWEDAKSYARWLSRKTGKIYGLPSEAQWEYAARANSSTARFWGESSGQACIYANVMDSTGKAQVPGGAWKAHDCSDGHAYTAPAGSFKASVFGLYDMIGNAWQWTEDCYHDTYDGAPGDGSSWTSGSCDRRVLRGGSWYLSPSIARSAYRSRSSPAERYSSIGFRLARALP